MNKLVDAERALVFEILSRDVRSAKRYDKNHCVIANALAGTPGIQKVEVGARYARVWIGNSVVRYQTPAILRTALNRFDSTGQWHLPAGIYAMTAPTLGRTLKHESEYDAKRTAAQKANKRKHQPHRKGIHALRHVNARVVEFAKIRQGVK